MSNVLENHGKVWTHEHITKLLLCITPNYHHLSFPRRKLNTAEQVSASEELGRTKESIRQVWSIFRNWLQRYEAEEKIVSHWNGIFIPALRNFRDFRREQNYSTSFVEKTKELPVWPSVGDVVLVGITIVGVESRVKGNGYIYLYCRKNGHHVIQREEDYEKSSLQGMRICDKVVKAKEVRRTISKKAMLKWLSDNDYVPRSDGSFMAADS